MASQNVDPTRVNANTRKQRDKSEISPAGLHSVAQRSVKMSIFIFNTCQGALL